MAAPYMPLYCGDYLGDTRHLSTEQHGAYLLLLMCMWRSGGTLPNSAKKLASMCGLTPSRWAKISDDVLAFFDVYEDTISSARLIKELKKFEEKSVKNSLNGKRGAEAKYLKTLNTNSANADVSLKQPEPEPESDKEIKPPLSPLPADEPKDASAFGSSQKKSRKRPSTPIPDGFPTSDVIDKAKESVSASSVTLDVDRQAFRFRNWALQGDKRYVDWGATFRNWIDKAISEAPKIVSVTSRDEIDWDARMKYFIEKKHWNEMRWGPHPKSSYCDVPAAILTKYGFGSTVIEFPKQQAMALPI